MVVLLSYLDLLIAAFVSVAVAAVTLLLPGWHSPLHVTLGLLMVLWTPGYMLVAGLFPKRRTLQAGERVALSVGLSFVIVAVAGFLLSYTPLGIRPNSVALALAAFTLVMVVIVRIQRGRLLPQERFTLLSLPPKPAELRRVGLGLVTLLALGTVFSFTSTLSSEATFTEFYLLGQSGDLTGYPHEVAAGQDLTLIFGIKNRETETTSYHLEGPGSITPTTLAEATLEQGETWEQPVNFRAPPLGGDARLEFGLYRNGDTAPYRTLYLNVTVITADGTPVQPQPQEDEPENTQLQRTAIAPAH